MSGLFYFKSPKDNFVQNLEVFYHWYLSPIMDHFDMQRDNNDRLFTYNKLQYHTKDKKLNLKLKNLEIIE